MRVALLVAVASLSALAVGPAASASGSDLAVTYQVDVAHSGVQSDDQLVPPLGRRWTATLPETVSYPLIAGGDVYVTVQGQNGAQLYALRASDGSTAWSASIPGTFSWASAAYDGGLVFAVNFDGVLRAFAADTGALQWATQLPGQSAFTSPPTASGGVVYVSGSGSGGTLYASTS
jgi:outer membrane protein assembly factor BamB